MEKELNYLSEKIQELEHMIDIDTYQRDKYGANVEHHIKELENEKELLENIMNHITVAEIS